MTEPASKDDGVLALARILTTTAVSMARNRKGRKRTDALWAGLANLDENGAPPPTYLMQRLVNTIRMLENEDRAMMMTAGQFMWLGGEHWTHSFAIKVGTVAARLFKEWSAMGKPQTAKRSRMPSSTASKRPQSRRPWKFETVTTSNGKVRVYPRGIIQQAYCAKSLAITTP